MSYFLCISSSGTFHEITEPSIDVQDISMTPFGRTTNGNRKKAKAYLLTMEGHSGWLIDKGPIRKQYSSSVKSIVRQLLEESPSVVLMIHLFQGRIDIEEIKSPTKITLPFHEFTEQFPDCEEDTWYVVVPSS